MDTIPVLTRGIVVEPIRRSDARPALYLYHYLKKFPAIATHCYGCWEDGEYHGAVVFGYDPGMRKYNLFGATMQNRSLIVLLRVALSGCQRSQTSAFVAAATRRIFKEVPQLRFIVSYADSGAGHVGTIYQAMNWIYTGTSCDKVFKIGDRTYHRRSVYSAYGVRSLKKLRQLIQKPIVVVKSAPKFRYVLPRTKHDRRLLEQIALPYPKRTNCGNDTTNGSLISAIDEGA